MLKQKKQLSDSFLLLIKGTQSLRPVFSVTQSAKINLVEWYQGGFQIVEHVMDRRVTAPQVEEQVLLSGGDKATNTVVLTEGAFLEHARD